ncbi:hypothetical protein Hypma_010030 [Hypsizygus marmoreus]|uniref:Uncharacterized protein n=1 Tax=Hypsizygus marmoreus TaxID=39966 RepID=A0A369JPS0_HYPMA|nr:hypothetical protein Hypma_010030 [Hypsizygus marmoreus]
MNETSWNNLQTNGDVPLDQRRNMYRASTAPAGEYPTHPRALMPGYTPIGQGRSDFYFTNPSRMSIAYDVRNTAVAPPPPIPLYPIQMAANIHSPPPPPRPPPLHASFTEPHFAVYFQRSLSSPPPPLPPKPPTRTPPALPELDAPDDHTTDSIPPAAPTITPSSHDSPAEESDMAMALALSQSVSSEEQRLRDKLSTQEEEDLAWALEASLRESGPPMSFSNAFASPSTDVRPRDLCVQTNFSNEHARPRIADDETLARILTSADEENRTPVSNTALESRSNETPVSKGKSPNLSQRLFPLDGEVSTSMSSSSKGNLVDDQVFARRLAQEDKTYEFDLPTIPEYKKISSTNPQSPVLPVCPAPDHIPAQSWQATLAEGSDDEAYARRLSEEDTRSLDSAADGVGSIPASASASTSSTSAPSSPESCLPYLSSPVSEAFGLSAFGLSPVVAQESLRPVVDARPPPSLSDSRTPQPTLEARLSQPVSDAWSPSNAGPSKPLPVDVGGIVRPEDGLISSSESLSHISSANSLSGDETEADSRHASSSNLGVINQNAFVDQKLFVGVSVGFKAPTISSRLVAMSDPMPNIISLPYGRCPPLHVHGPSWRHLLRLMAMLSGTRLEPTLDAVAVTKTDLKLRTVIQFIKPHPSSTDWRTVFYFTIDYPSPHHTHQSVNDLPYSYTLSSIPPLLQDAADTPISKTYTIPASDSLPYPTLPITFPNLAMYLQAALEESRKYLNDSSSGHRKLAKMVQTCYRSEDVPRDATERHSVGGLFKRVMGRSSKPRRGGNEDTYELVTPFVPDEWG